MISQFKEYNDYTILIQGINTQVQYLLTDEHFLFHHHFFSDGLVFKLHSIKIRSMFKV